MTNKFRDQDILVIGDIMVDHYIEGTVERISPEAPIPILDKKKEWYRLGGAANVALNLASLGAQVTQIGRVGSDDYAKYVIETLESHDINSIGVFIDSSVPTTVKTRFISNNHQILRVDHEDRSSVENTEIGHNITEFILQELPKHSAVILSDYNKGVIYSQLVAHILQNTNVPVIVDTHKKHWDMFTGCTCLTPNLKELRTYTNFQLADLEQITRIAQLERQHLQLKCLLVTLGDQGMLLVTETETHHFPAHPVSVVDVTGAGDTALAVFTLALSAGSTPDSATVLANKAASIVVSKMGTSCLTLQELCS